MLSTASAQFSISYFNNVGQGECPDSANYAGCDDIAPQVCCLASFTNAPLNVQGSNLDATGFPDIVSRRGKCKRNIFTLRQANLYLKITAYTNDDEAGCATSCDSGGGDSTECVGCSGSPELGGAIISAIGSKRAATVAQSVHPNVAGIFDSNIKTHRRFRIGSSVPANVLDELRSAVMNGTKVHELSDAVMQFEITS